jgi:hypothetical protein
MLTFFAWLCAELHRLDRRNPNAQKYIDLLPLAQLLWVYDRECKEWVMGVQLASDTLLSATMRTVLFMMLIGNEAGGTTQLSMGGYRTFAVVGNNPAPDLTLLKRYPLPPMHWLVLSNDRNIMDDRAPGLSPSVLFRLLFMCGVPLADILRMVLSWNGCTDRAQLPKVQILFINAQALVRFFVNYKFLAAWPDISLSGQSLTSFSTAPNYTISTAENAICFEGRRR